MTDLLTAVVAFGAGFVIGVIYRKVCADEDKDGIARLRRQVAMWKAKALIVEAALRESQDRHHRVLEENGHDRT